MAFSVLQSKEAIKTLFGEVAEKVGGRPGGYTRIIKTGYRLGDNAEMCIIELVDFNELMLKDAKPAKKTTRRSRRGSGQTADSNTSAANATDQETVAPEAEDESAPAAEAPEVTPDAEASEATPDEEEGKAGEPGTNEEDKKGE